MRIGSQPCGAPLASNAPPAPQLLGDAQLRFAVDVSKPGNLRRLGTVTREPGQPLAPGHHHRASTHRVVIDVLLQRGPHSHLVIGTWAGGAWRSVRGQSVIRFREAWSRFQASMKHDSPPPICNLHRHRESEGPVSHMLQSARWRCAGYAPTTPPQKPNLSRPHLAMDDASEPFMLGQPGLDTYT